MVIEGYGWLYVVIDGYMWLLRVMDVYMWLCRVIGCYNSYRVMGDVCVIWDIDNTDLYLKNGVQTCMVYNYEV